MNRLSIRQSLALGAASCLVLGAGVVGITIMPASATDGYITGEAHCNNDGTWYTTWVWNSTNVPNDVEAEVKAMTTSAGRLVAAPGNGVDKGGQIFLSTWTEHQINNPGVAVHTGNWSDSFSTADIPADVASVTVMVQYDYTNNHSDDPVHTVPNPGTCTTPEPPTETPTIPTPTEPTPTTPTDTPTVPTETPTVPTETPTIPTPTEEPPTTPPTEEPPTEQPPTTTPPTEPEPTTPEPRTPDSPPAEDTPASPIPTSVPAGV